MFTLLLQVNDLIQETVTFMSIGDTLSRKMTEIHEKT